MRRSSLLVLPSLCVPFLLAATLNHATLEKEGNRWWSHIEVLASDGMQGRNTGSPGHRAAAEFVASQFERAGLKPAGTDGYLQPVKFRVAQIDESRSSLVLLRPGMATALELGVDANLGVNAQLEGTTEADVAFCGYGLAIPEYNYDDFSGQDLKGKICMILAGGPSNIPGNLRSHYGFRSERWKAAHRAGVIGFLNVANPKSMDIPWERSTLARLNAAMEIADPRFSDTQGRKFAAAANPARAEQFFEKSGHTFAEMLTIADEGAALPRFPLNIRLRSTTALNLSEVESQNVAGVLPGSDPALKSEYVVFGAHLDHLGVGNPVPNDSKADRIYNGAMDDGSGIATLIEVATLMHEQNLKPKRSILFLAVTGEEKGLLGSEYFTAAPTVPLQNIVAEINNDMYLPLFPLKYLQVMGLEESTLGADVRAAAQNAGVIVQPDPEPNRNLFIRSDQYNFIRRGIPALTFKFGYLPGSPEQKLAKDWLRERYHAPSDDLQQPVDKAAAAKYNRLMLDLGLRVANASERPHWLETSFFKRFVAN